MDFYTLYLIYLIHRNPCCVLQNYISDITTQFEDVELKWHVVLVYRKAHFFPTLDCMYILHIPITGSITLPNH